MLLIIGVLIAGSLIYWYEIRIGRVVFPVVQECLKQATDYGSEKSKQIEDFSERLRVYETNHNTFYEDCLRKYNLQDIVR